MTAESRRQKSSPLKEELGLWKTLGCFVWIALPFLLAIPLWLTWGLDYGEAVHYTVDVLLLGCLLAVIFILAYQIWHKRGRASVGDFLLIPLAVGLSAMSGWNLAALYISDDITPIVLGGFTLTAGWGMLVLLATMFFVWTARNVSGGAH